MFDSVGLTTKSASGMFGPVSAPNGVRRIDPSAVVQKEDGSRESRLVDEESIPDEYREGIEADDFVIYGKASVEQYDEDGQVVDVGALEGSLEQLYKSGNISRRHKDVRVGEPLPEWTLDEDRTLELGDETYEFRAGDTLTTGVNPDIVEERRVGEGTGEDEFWLASDIWNDTEIGKDTRLRTMSGDLNGFSVTIYAKEKQPTAKGEGVTEVDFHAVTIGSDDAIKNKASRFDIAEFKAMFTDEGAHGRVPEVATSIARNTMFESLFSKSADEVGFNGELAGAAVQASQKAQTEDVDLKAAAEEVAADADFKSDDVLSTISALSTETKAGDDLAEVIKGVEEGDLSTEEALEVIDGGAPDEGGPDEEMKDEDEGEGPPVDEDEPPEDDPSDDDPEDDEPSFEEKLAEHGVVTEDKLDEKLGQHADNVAEKLGDSVPSADEIASKMDVGATDSPSSGTGQQERDLGKEIKEQFGDN